MSDDGKNAYEILEVATTATAEDIRAAYLRLVERYHPDRHTGNPLQELAAARLAAANQAYDTLSDQARRAAYDATAGAGPSWTAPRVRREISALVVLLRVLSLTMALLLLVRVVPSLWRGLSRAPGLLGETVAALRGPAGLILAGLVAAVLLARVWRGRVRPRR